MANAPPNSIRQLLGAIFSPLILDFLFPFHTKRNAALKLTWKIIYTKIFYSQYIQYDTGSI